MSDDCIRAVTHAPYSGNCGWKKSKVIPKTLNPTWNESFILPVANPDTDMLELRVYDKDLIVDDSIGS